MKLNFLFIVFFIVGTYGCSNVDDLPVNSFVDKTWQLQSDNGSNETVVFSKDSTYKITTELLSVVNGLPSSTGYLKGSWQYKNGQIRFKTANVELLGSNSTVPETPVITGQPIGTFYGSGFNSIFNINSTIGSDYVPLIWTIKELTSSKLTVESNKTTLIYIEKKFGN
jgi:hypothetical protein